MADSWAQRALLQRSKPKHIHNLFGKQFMLPQKNTDVMDFRRQENLNSDPVVLAEDSDPAPEKIQKFDVQVQVQEFGKVVLLTRKVNLIVEDDTANEIADNLNQCMHTMLDKVTRDVLASSVNQINCVNGTNGETITELNQIDVNRAIEFLDINDTEHVSPIIPGSPQIGTSPIQEAYWAMAHVELKKDIRSLASFLPVAEYGSIDESLKSEFGATDEARWVTSTLVTKSSASPPVFDNTFVGANAYGYVSIDEVSAEMIMKPLGFNDYLNRFQSMGFTAWFNAGVLDDSHIVILKATKSS
jgi:N4-gp56 family major capsid protein